MNRISTRLAVSFLLVALLPAIPLSLVVQDLLDRRFGPAIADPLETALDAGLNESRSHLRALRTRLMEQAEQIEQAESVMHTREERLSSPVLLDAAGTVQPADSLQVFLDARPQLEAQLLQLPTGPVRRLDDVLAVVVADENTSLTVIQPLPAGMVERAGHLTEGVSLLRLVRDQKSRVQLSFLGPFLVIYVLLIAVALIAGVLWSRQMVRPLEMLVGATRRVAGGDLEFRIKQQGPGEVGELVHSFDNMVGRLADQRRDLARLERASAWRGMARTLAHEVKNPLTPILLAVHQVRDSYQGDDEEYRHLLNEVSEIVGEEVDSLRRLVREFGDFARLPKPKPSAGDLTELLHDLAQLYGSDSLILELGTDNINGWFDHDALRRALINLIDNGLQASRQDGQHVSPVELRCQPQETGVQLEIADQGVGISPENLERIFEPDFTTKNDGMGLGLAIVENIIIGHGGRITVESEMGQGTTFTMVLPLTEPANEDKES